MYRQLPIKKLKTKMTNSLRVVFLLLFIVAFLLLYFIEEKRFDNAQNEFDTVLHKSMQHAFKNNIRIYTFFAKKLVYTSRLKEYLKNSQRVELYEHLKPKWKFFLEENPYLENLTIHNPDGTVFLRMHKPEVYGDSVIETSPMIKAIHKQKVFLRGLETIKTKTIFRILMPIFDDDKYIGALEVGINIIYFIKKAEEIIGNKILLFVNKEKAEYREKESNILISNFLLQDKVDDETNSLLKALPSNYMFETEIKIDYKDRSYVIHTTEINDFDGETGYKLLFFQDVTSEQNSKRYILFMVTFLIFIFGLILFVSLRRYFNEFEKKLSRFYQNNIKAIKFSQSYLKAIEDASPNLIVTSFGNKMYSANKAFYTFTGYKNVEEFRSEHNCICDLFEKKEGFLQKEMNGMRWAEYVLKRPDIIHKAVMKKSNKEYIFIVKTNRLEFDDNQRSMTTLIDITDFEKANSELQELSQRFSLFMDFIPGLVFIKNEDLEIIYANKSMKNWYQKNDLEGLTIYDLSSKEVADDITKKDKKVLKEGFLEYIHEVVHSSGEKYTFRTMKFIIPQKNNQNYIGQISVDITEEYNLSKYLKKNQYLLKESQKLAHIGSWEMNFSNNELVWSDEVYKIFGIINKESINNYEDFKKFIHQDDKEEVDKTYHDSIENHTNYFIVHRIIKEDTKEVRYVEERCEHIYDENENIIKSIGTVQDITEKVLFEKELKNKEEIMIAQSRHAAMGEMISMIAHQWRQPITIIAMGANNILADIELNMVDLDEFKSEILQIVKQTQHLSKTIDDFRDFFRPNKEKELIKPKDILEETIAIVGKSLENNDIEVISDYECDVEIETYSRELLQVSISIIKNAKDVLVERNIKNKKITIKVSEVDSDISIKICDNAGGIPKEIIDRIFDPYFSTKDAKTGTGLGLYMSKIIIEQHLNGILEAENLPEGACFIITLPK